MANVALTLDVPANVAGADAATFAPPPASWLDFGTPQYRISAPRANVIGVWSNGAGIARNKPNVPYVDCRIAGPVTITFGYVDPAYTTSVTITKRSLWQRAFG